MAYKKRMGLSISLGLTNKIRWYLRDQIYDFLIKHGILYCPVYGQQKPVAFKTCCLFAMIKSFCRNIVYQSYIIYIFARNFNIDAGARGSV